MKTNNPKNSQRQAALSLLEAQLTAGTKPAKVDGKTTRDQIPLTDTDKTRIQKEIETLRKRIV